MSREDSIAESAKQRSLRVALDHYQRPNPLARIKLWLTLTASVIAIAYSTWLAMPTPAARQQVSPGPLAAVHATWNNDCAACHQDFQPLRSDALSLVTLLRGQKPDRQSLDASCLKCHNTPVHHAHAKTKDVPTCAACHHDHEGIAADIVRPRDAMCLGCHRESESHRDGPSRLTPVLENVSGFGPAPAGNEAPHPDFRSLKSDPGNIKFNHWLHMQPGIAVANAKKKLELSHLNAADRPRYAAYAKTGKLIQLDCVACHELEATGGGESIRPIAFEQHCRACHPLEIQVAASQPAAKLPHGLDAQRLTTILDGLIVAAEQRPADVAPTTDESGKLPLIPGRTLGNNLSQKINADLLGRRTTMGRAVMARCQECHEPHSTGEEAETGVSDVLPANIPAVWLRHARFDHAAHRHVECRSCHAGTYAFMERNKPQFIKPAPGQAAARDSEQVMIAGLESCVSCHAPARGTSGGARHDCAECHRYHGGDHALSVSLSSPSFPGSSLGTRDLEAPASPSRQNTSPAIRLASFDSVGTRTPTFTGPASCAASGCHGDAHGATPNWKNAFTVFEANDPHGQAYDVLWTVRGREMTRLVESKDALTDVEHKAAIERRCIGCHATPPPTGLAAGAEPFAAGVHCESCHGAAGEWLHTHYQAGFRRDGSAGFIDTKNLSERAATCMKCHVGPSNEQGSPQVVDHDLIAAGHPRLSFELRSYYESKPAHWDREADEQRQPGAFGFQLWLSGQLAQAQQRAKLIPSDQTLVDFSQLECAACHHGLGACAWRQPAPRELLRVNTPPALRHLQAAAEILPVSGRLALVREILTDAGTSAGWDRALEAYLAVRAVLADVKPDKFPRVATEIGAANLAVESLGLYLARDCFTANRDSNAWPTQYDSPGRFEPRAFAERAQAVSSSLQRLEAAVAAP